MGDSGLSKLSAAEAKEKWKEVRHRPTYKMEEFLIYEKGHERTLVEKVLEELTPPAAAAVNHTNVPGLEPLPLDYKTLGRQEHVEPEGADNTSENEVAEAMLNMAGVASL